MRGLMFLLCLIASLTGTSLRQAEKADDLARSLGELGGRDVIELVDGGVGDDSGETVLESDGAVGPTRAGDLPTPDLLSPPLLPAAPSAWTLAGRPGGRPSPSLLCSGRRHAWLQRFLF